MCSLFLKYYLAPASSECIEKLVTRLKSYVMGVNTAVFATCHGTKAFPRVWGFTSKMVHSENF